MPRFEHRDGLAVEVQDGRAVLRWRGASGTVLSEAEMRWLITTGLPAALAIIAPPRGYARSSVPSVVLEDEPGTPPTFGQSAGEFGQASLLDP